MKHFKDSTEVIISHPYSYHHTLGTEVQHRLGRLALGNLSLAQMDVVKITEATNNSKDRKYIEQKQKKPPIPTLYQHTF